MAWKEVARQHLNLFAEVLVHPKHIPVDLMATQQSSKVLDELPEISFSHLKNMTDDTGIIRYAKNNIPDFHSGYCIDDSARARQSIHASTSTKAVL